LNEPYPNRIRTVLAPYLLRSEVPLYGETTELVRSKYGSGTVQVQSEYKTNKVFTPQFPTNKAFRHYVHYQRNKQWTGCWKLLRKFL